MNPLLKIWSYFLPIRLKTYESKYSSKIEVALENGTKVLNTQKVNYSYNSLHRVFQYAFEQTQLHITDQSEILMLGLGGGSIVKIIRKECNSKAPITAIEIDPAIVEVAVNDFQIKKWGQPINIIIHDAYTFTENLNLQFEVICIDIFIHDEVPSAFLSHTFFNKIIESLKSGGKLYFNFMDSMPEKTRLFDQIILNAKNNSTIKTEVLQLEENNRVLVITK